MVSAPDTQEPHVNLLVVQGQPAGKVLAFAPGTYFLGRGPECHIRFNSDWVSRQHCQIRFTRDALFVRDLGSRNGTLVNGRLITAEEKLGEGDQIQIGPLVFEVRASPPAAVPDLPHLGEGLAAPGEEPSQEPTASHHGLTLPQTDDETT